MDYLEEEFIYELCKRVLHEAELGEVRLGVDVREDLADELGAEGFHSDIATDID